MVTNLGFDDGHPYVEVGADEGRFVFTAGRVAVTTASAEAVLVQVDRSVDNGESWEPVITDIAPEQGAGFVDWESPVYGEILYRATAYTVEGHPQYPR